MPSPEHAAIVDHVNSSRQQRAELSLAERRALDREGFFPVPEGVTMESVAELPGSLMLTPPEPSNDLVVVLIHGGGFRIGAPAGERAFGGSLALLTGARVLCPAYRLAPEDPYPAAIDDCERAYLYVRDRMPQARIVVCGGSAGANLAAALLLRRRDAQDERVAAGLLFSGLYDLRPDRWSSGSWVGNEITDPILTVEDGPDMQAAYAGATSPEDPGVSPLLADLTDLPPLLLFASNTEMLRDDSLEFAAKAARAGVDTTLRVRPGLIHGWAAFAGFMPEADEAVEQAAAFIAAQRAVGNVPV